MMRQVGLSIEERRAQFLRQFPNKQISITQYRKVYKKHYIRKKKIKITKIMDDTLRRRIKKTSAQTA